MSKLKIDIDDLRAIAELVAETGLTEIEIESEGISLRVAKEVPQVVTQAQVQVPAAAPMAAPMAAPAAPAAAAPAAAGDDDPFAGATPVGSPMVGTAYVAAEPGAAPFVKVGDMVSEGQTVMIVEAMKTMNPVPATKSGKVVAVMVENEQPVEFDQPLVLIA